MRKSEIIRFVVIRTIGNFLVLFSLYGVGMTFGPVIVYQAQFQIAQARGVRFVVADANPKNESNLGAIVQKEEKKEEQKGFADVISGPKEQVLRPKNTQFSIVIPKIAASAVVIPNVDSSSESEYLTALQKGVAHAKGSVFPGIKGNTYLFAHSADTFWNAGRYNAVFYLLKELTVEDEVVVFFENKRYNYKIKTTQVVEPNDVSLLLDSQTSGVERLVLQTCWPPGTTWKRLILTARPAGEEKQF